MMTKQGELQNNHTKMRITKQPQKRKETRTRMSIPGFRTEGVAVDGP